MREFYAKRQPPAVTSAATELAAVATQAQPAPDPEAEALALKRRGNDRYDAQDFEGAVELYSEAIKVAPSSVLHANRAAAYMMLGWWEQALRDTKAALRKDPCNSRALERQGRVLLALDRLEDALKVAEDLRQSGGVQPSGVSRLSWLVAQVRQPPASLRELREVMRAFGSTPAESSSPLGCRLRRRLVRALVEQGDLVDNQRQVVGPGPVAHADAEMTDPATLATEALAVADALLSDGVDDQEVHYWRSLALVRLGRHAEAEAQLRQGIGTEERDHTPSKELFETLESLEQLKAQGNRMYRQGRMADAIVVFSEGIGRDPECLDARTVAILHYNRSAAYRKRGEFQKALDDVNTALALHPKWAKALYRRAILLLECGRTAEALTELKIVQRTDPLFHEDLEDWLRRAHNWLAKPRGEPNYYELMQLPMDATADDVRRQHKKLCLLWHPDKDPSDEGRQRFDALQSAFAFLSDAGQREAYDFGNWKDKPVRHHLKTTVKAGELRACQPEDAQDDLYEVDRHLIEDDKVESIYWGSAGCPEHIEVRRREARRRRYADDDGSC